ncbi:MAG: NUDIX hydrolase [Thermotogota bacterium]
MSFYKEFEYDADLNKADKTFVRETVKGVVLKGEQILMIHSLQNGDYKFPGGGLEKGETPVKAMTREIKEECAAEVHDIGKKIGTVIEYKKAREPEYDVFKMVSDYYLCQVIEKSNELNLDRYEQELGFHPVWVSISEAINQNKKVFESNKGNVSEWTEREIFVLESLKS